LIKNIKIQLEFMWREAKRGYPKPTGNTRTPSGMGLRFYFFSPLKIGMSMWIPELYGFEFWKGKIHPRPTPLPYQQPPKYHLPSKDKLNSHWKILIFSSKTLAKIIFKYQLWISMLAFVTFAYYQQKVYFWILCEKSLP
jgi:hypothetical protein